MSIYWGPRGDGQGISHVPFEHPDWQAERLLETVGMTVRDRTLVVMRRKECGHQLLCDIGGWGTAYTVWVRGEETMQHQQPVLFADVLVVPSAPCMREEYCLRRVRKDEGQLWAMKHSEGASAPAEQVLCQGCALVEV